MSGVQLGTNLSMDAGHAVGVGPLQETVPDLDSPRGDPNIAMPHVIAWNITRRCNLACAHCYISAGAWHEADNELDTNACFRVIDEILAVNPGPLLILSGGEPLVREDLEEVADYASRQGATVVVGTNGTGLTDKRIESLMAAGVQGVALSVDSLNPQYHDRFRHGEGALGETLAAVDRLGRHELDFLVQVSVTKGNRSELENIIAWADEKGAVCVNVYFLVETGRGAGMRGLKPDENEEILEQLCDLQREYRGRMMVRSKCQPQLMRHVYERDHDSSLLHYQTRCPCGVQYCRITPEGKVTPCPYMPEVAGDLTARTFGDIWKDAKVFKLLRNGDLGGKCGRCEYREVCGGCRARAYAVDGDFLGPDLSCAYEPAPGVAPIVPVTRDVMYGESPTLGLPWSPEAEARLSSIPSFVRGVVGNRIEKFAIEAGYDLVTLEVMSEVRKGMPIDFSKRMPFFARGRSGKLRNVETTSGVAETRPRVENR